MLQTITTNPLLSFIIGTIVISGLAFVVKHFGLLNFFPSILWSKIGGGSHHRDFAGRLAFMRYSNYAIRNKSFRNIEELSVFLDRNPTGIHLEPEYEHEIKEAAPGKYVLVIRGIESRTTLVVSFSTMDLPGDRGIEHPNIKHIRSGSLKVSEVYFRGVSLRSNYDDAMSSLFNLMKFIFVISLIMALIQNSITDGKSEKPSTSQNMGTSGPDPDMSGKRNTQN